MGLTTALFTSLSGLNSNSQAITVTGNNIANVNTIGYKSSRATFETQISQTLASGSAPTAKRGGTNPIQIGLGTHLGAISRNFSSGALETTGINTDMAIDGNGFFTLELDGNTHYSRAGTFQLDRNFRMVGPDGGRLQGLGVDSDFQVVNGVMGDLVIPIGSLTLAEATQTVNFAGNLNAGGDVATGGTTIVSSMLFSDGGGGTVANAEDDLVDLFGPDLNPLFNMGDVISVTGAQKGGATLPTHTFEVGPANTSSSDMNGETLGSFALFLEQVLGIDTDVSGGVIISEVSGQIVIQGNSGASNDLSLEGTNIIINEATDPRWPFLFSKQISADGESVRTTFTAFDSLGAPMTFDMSVVLEEKTNLGTAWRFYVQSADDTDLDRVLGNGTLEFDTNGQLITTDDTEFFIDRFDSGAFTPQEISAVFDEFDIAVSALASATSHISAVSQDGSAIGTLEDFSVANDGTIVGVFANGSLRTLGQVTLAQFANPQGLEDVGGNLFRVTDNSGIAAIVTPGTGGTGRIIGGALELSNVELSQEFISLITASTGFSANSRVLTTSDRLIQELLAAVR